MQAFSYDRSYKVVKSNELITRSRYMLPLSSQKMFAFICSLIKPSDPSGGIPPPDQMIYSFDIRRYCIICGIDFKHGGGALAYIKHTLKKLADYSVYVSISEDKEVLCRLIDEVTIDKANCTATVKIGKYLTPFLKALTERFTSYELSNILCMKSAYSIRLYEIFKSFQFQREVKISTDDIRRYVFTKTIRCSKCQYENSRKCFMCDEYKNYYREYSELKRRVIDVAIDEINRFTDISVTMVPHKYGKTVAYVTFKIRVNTIEENCQKFFNYWQVLGMPKEDYP